MQLSGGRSLGTAAAENAKLGIGSMSFLELALLNTGLELSFTSLISFYNKELSSQTPLLAEYFAGSSRLAHRRGGVPAVEVPHFPRSEAGGREPRR